MTGTPEASPALPLMMTLLGVVGVGTFAMFCERRNRARAKPKAKKLEVSVSRESPRDSRSAWNDDDMNSVSRPTSGGFMTPTSTKAKKATKAANKPAAKPKKVVDSHDEVHEMMSDYYV